MGNDDDIGEKQVNIEIREQPTSSNARMQVEEKGEHKGRYQEDDEYGEDEFQ